MNKLGGKTMKKLMAILLVLALMLSLAACGGSSSSNEPEKKPEEAVEEAAEEATVEAAEEATEEAAAEAEKKVEEPAEEVKEEPASADLPKERAGTYYLTGMVNGGEETKATDLALMEEAGMIAKLVLNEDGTGTMTLFGEESVVTWNDQEVLVDGEGAVYTWEEGKIILSDGEDSLTFTAKTAQEIASEEDGSEVAEEPEIEETPAATADGKTLEQAVSENTVIQQGIEQVAASSGLEVEIEDNLISFIYRYSSEYDDNTIAAMVPAIEQSLESSKATFINMVKELEKSTSVEGITLRILYIDGSGKEIFSADYHATDEIDEGAEVTTSAAPGSYATFEEYVNADANLQKQLGEIAESNGLEITIKENVMTYIYQFEETYDEEQMAAMMPAIESALAGYQETFSGMAKDLEKATGVSGIKIVVTYIDASGAEIYGTEFTAEE